MTWPYCCLCSRKNGEELNIDRLSKDTGCKVVEISALKGEGIDQLIQRAVAIAKSRKNIQPAHKFDGCVEHAIAHIEEAKHRKWRKDMCKPIMKIIRKKLFPKETVAAGDWAAITAKCQEALGYIAKARA